MKLKSLYILLFSLFSLSLSAQIESQYIPPASGGGSGLDLDSIVNFTIIQDSIFQIELVSGAMYKDTLPKAIYDQSDQDSVVNLTIVNGILCIDLQSGTQYCDTINSLSDQLVIFYLDDKDSDTKLVSPSDTIMQDNGLERDSANGFDIGLGGRLVKNTSITADSNSFTFNQLNQVYLQTNEFASILFPFFPQDSFSWRFWSLDVESNRSVAGVSEGMAAIGSINGPTGQKNIFLGDPDGAFVYADDGFWILSPANDTSSFVKIDTAMLSEVSETAWLIGINADSTLYRVPWADIAGQFNQIITSDTPLTDQDSLRRDPDGGTHVFDKGLNAEMKIGYDYYVDSIPQIYSRKFELGKIVHVVGTGARYIVASDTLTGYATDSVVVIPCQNGYAILYEDVLRPQYWGAIANDGPNTDDEAINKMFRFIENMPPNLSSKYNPFSIVVEFPPGAYDVDSTCWLPRKLGKTGAFYTHLHLIGKGAKITNRGAKWIFKVIGSNATLTDDYMPANSTVWDRIDYHINLEGFEFNGTLTSGRNGIFITGATYSQFQGSKFTFLDTAAVWAVSYGSTYRDMEFSSNGTYSAMFLTQKAINGGTHAAAGFTTNTIESLRSYGGNWKSNTDLTRSDVPMNRQLASFYFYGPSGCTIKDCVSEGTAPFYDVHFNLDGNTVANYNKIERLWLESSVYRQMGIYYENPRGVLDIVNPIGEVSSDTFMRVRAVSAPAIVNIRATSVFPSYEKVYVFNSDLSERSGNLVTVNYEIYDASASGPSTAKIYELVDSFQYRVNVNNSTFINNANGITLSKYGYTSYRHDEKEYYAFNPVLNLIGNIWFPETVDGFPTYSRVGRGQSSGDVGKRPMSFYARQEGFVTDIGGQFGFSPDSEFNRNNYALNQFFAYSLRMDSTGYAANTGLQNIFIDVGSADEFRFYNNGQAKFEGYSNTYNKSAGNIGKTLYRYGGWTTDGTLVHVETIPSTDITSFGDSSTIKLEIDGILTRLDDLGTGGSGTINEGFSLGNGADVFKITSNDSLLFRSLVPGGGITLTQTDTTINIAATGLYGAIQSFSPTDTLDWNLNSKISGAAHIDCTSVSTGVGLNIINPNTSFASYYTLYFYNVSGTDAITFPDGWIGEDGTALGTVNITANKYYACQYLGIDASNLYLCK